MSRSKDYEYLEDEHKIELTAVGRSKVRAIPKPDSMAARRLIDLYQYIERAIKVHRDFFLDRQYVVRDGEIVIVDENTGRLAEGRKWRTASIKRSKRKRRSKSRCRRARPRG